MPVQTTTSNANATTAALPKGNLTLNVVQGMVNTHLRFVRSRKLVKITVPEGAPTPSAIYPVILEEALLAGEPV
jgi:hypothetical protein